MKIIKQSQVIESVEFFRTYDWVSDPGAGFSFRCDKDGSVDESKLAHAAYENYRKCVDGTYEVIDKGVQVYHRSYHEPAVGECVCGAEVFLTSFTNTCDRCERDYNWAGQMLAPREQWGAETNEHWSDIVGPSYPDDDCDLY